MAATKSFLRPSNILQHQFQCRGSFRRLKYRRSNRDSNSDINTHLLQHHRFSNIQSHSHRNWTGNMVHQPRGSHHGPNDGIVGARNHAHNTIHLPAHSRRQHFNRRRSILLPREWSRELRLRASNPRGLSRSRSILPRTVSRPHIMPPRRSINPPYHGTVQNPLEDYHPKCCRRRFD